MIEESKYFQQFIEERNLSKATVKQYRATLRQYCKFNSMTLDQLLEEADNEEEAIKIANDEFRCIFPDTEVEFDDAEAMV